MVPQMAVCENDQSTCKYYFVEQTLTVLVTVLKCILIWSFSKKDEQTVFRRAETERKRMH